TRNDAISSLRLNSEITIINNWIKNPTKDNLTTTKNDQHRNEHRRDNLDKENETRTLEKE
ncbi:MAG: hypothetical protein EZS28_038759, partial [Streblomastix strix]